jgi:cytochrome c oxidase subunit III
VNKNNINDLEAPQTLSMDPKKFMLWLFIVASVMLFASQTSAYLVRRAESNWVLFEVPKIFWYSTGVLILSSVTMHFALYSAKKDNFNALKTAISITFVLGLVFLWMQFEGWRALVEQKIYFVGNPSQSFFYVFTFLHGVHILLALLVLAITFVSAMQMNIHAKKLRRIEICTVFWHFLDVLWIYLFAFLLYFR